MTTVPSSPAAPLDQTTPVRWQEPTRINYTGRLEYAGRYTASLVILLFAVYLQLNSNMAQLVQATAFKYGNGPDYIALFGFQFAFVVVCYILAFAIAPTTVARRAIAIGATLLLFAIWVIFFAGRLTGSINLPGGPFLGIVFTSSAYVGVLIAVLGWLIVRERPGLSYLVLIVVPLIGVIVFALAYGGASAGVSQLVVTPIATIIGVGAAWAARGLATLVQRPAYAAAPAV